MEPDPRRLTQKAEAIDIVVPVFNAPDDLERCVASVLRCTSGSFRLLLIDDGSHDPGVAERFVHYASLRDPRVALLRNERNLGFTATANRGMTASRADVVLLNSDTIVTHGWLDALVRCAASDPRIATVTPFSNNAEICSFPRLCEDDGWTAERDPEPTRQALAGAAVPTYPDLPTGVGFCMFVRRAALDALGAFDPVFGAGYGEENDFCLRAARAGWRNVLADDAFVVHAGERSFEGRKRELGKRNLALLVARHPHYTAMVERYIAEDPLRALREAARSKLALQGPMRGVLHVIHDHGGGTETHVRELIVASRARWRHYLAIADGDSWQVEEHRRDGSVATYGFERRAGERWRDFVGALCATFRIALIHLHNISGCREGLIEALAQPPVPFGYTLHDLNFACPTITFLDARGRFCGGETDVHACQQCVAAQPAHAHVDVTAWRAAHARLVADAAFVIAPSRWALTMFGRYFDRRDVPIVPHGTAAPGLRAPGAHTAVLLPRDGLPVVVVLGAIGPDKGARRVERLARLAAQRDAPVRFVVIGYLDVERGPWQSDDARLTVHGEYDPRDLPDLLAHYGAALVLYPSEGPETFSYTLSEAWHAGLPALVPPIGALRERVEEAGGGWVLSEDEWRDDARMLDRLIELLSAPMQGARERAASRARAVSQPTPEAMAQATLARYDAAVAASPRQSAAASFDNARVRDALGYRAWSPPAAAPDHAAESMQDVMNERRANGVWQRIAERALAMRRTPMGRVLYRMTPAPVIDALKARLHG
jgi:GT2 family glycosyltransferase/glycosyltransferase involved in cell wall biosynthesis